MRDHVGIRVRPNFTPFSQSNFTVGCRIPPGTEAIQFACLNPTANCPRIWSVGFDRPPPGYGGVLSHSPSSKNPVHNQGPIFVSPQDHLSLRSPWALAWIHIDRFLGGRRYNDRQVFPPSARYQAGSFRGRGVVSWILGNRCHADIAVPVHLLGGRSKSQGMLQDSG